VYSFPLEETILRTAQIESLIEKSVSLVTYYFAELLK